MMKCLSPVTIEGTYNAKEKKTVYTTNRKTQASETNGYMVSCGQCIACRINRARIWSVRNAHEAMFHDQHCFITLTYNPESLPDDLSVSNEVHQNFLKRLRKTVWEQERKKIRFYMAAEYGQPDEYEKQEGLSRIGRPHYHYLIYGWTPKDLEYLKTVKEHHYYTSETVLKAWQNQGFVVIGNVTPESAAYVAGYCTKKITGDSQEEHYTRIHPDTGQIVKANPEFQRCSIGIGKQWVEKYHNDLRKGYIVFDGKIYPVPRYYMQVLDKMCDELPPGNQKKLQLIELIDDIQQNRVDETNFEVLPDFEKLNYRYDVAKVYQERATERQTLNEQF